jgi:RNA polymerase sigma-70 factor (ECF subfamily)
MSMSNATASTSSSLLERVKAQDAEAWRRLIQLYGPFVYHWCAKQRLVGEDASDVFQEVFRAVSTNIAEFDHGRTSGTFRGWLRTITLNKIRDHFRRLSDRAPAVGGSEYQQFLAQLPDEQSADSQVDETEQAAAVLFRRGLELVQSEFEERTWQAFWKITVEQRRAPDVAAELGMTPTAVRKAKSRVLRRLREELIDPLDGS